MLLHVQTPWLASSRAHIWQRLTSKGWLQAVKLVAIAMADWLAMQLHVPAPLNCSIDVAALPGSGALCELTPPELQLLQQATQVSVSQVCMN